MTRRATRSVRQTKPQQAANAATQKACTAKVEHVPLSAIRPSPENDQLYRPIDPQDPEIDAEDMDPIRDVVTGIIPSGVGWLLQMKEEFSLPEDMTVEQLEKAYEDRGVGENAQ